MGSIVLLVGEALHPVAIGNLGAARDGPLTGPESVIVIATPKSPATLISALRHLPHLPVVAPVSGWHRDEGDIGKSGACLACSACLVRAYLVWTTNWTCEVSGISHRRRRETGADGPRRSWPNRILVCLLEALSASPSRRRQTRWTCSADRRACVAIRPRSS